MDISETVIAFDRGEPKAPGEHRSEGTAVRERGAQRSNARIARLERDQSRRRMTPINFPWIRTDG